MSSGATILDDRETVELLRDHPHLLAIADAVRATQGKETRSLPRRKLLLIAAAVAACAAAAIGFGVSTLFQGSSHRGSGPVPARPDLGRPGITSLGNGNPFGADGKLVTLQQFVADMAKRGYNVPLPDSPLANSNNVGNVWEAPSGAAIAYYPSSGIELTYGGTGIDYVGVPGDEIQEINGVRAIVESAGTQGFTFATVMLPLPSGHLVTLLSKGPVSDLVSVAKTLQGALPAEPPHFLPIDLSFTRGDQGITSIGVTINASTLGGTALVRVVRVVGADITETSLAGGKVVFQEHVPMTNLASPKSGPPGTQPLSTWSGTLSPSDWDGGCQSAKYVITVKVSPGNPTPEARGEWVESGMFICSSHPGG
ncbi:MAG TPA: hypothetical protein VJ716_00410 [Gaiellaceae bacterium]|nr:hypothetical protein [Gaiellaceae bacterium]